MPEDQRPYAVLDIDATLSDTSQRIKFLDRKPKDWDSFFAHAKDDAVLDEGLAVATTLAADHDIVYLTGRPERLRRDTVKWLKDNGFPEGAKLLMRGNNDRRPSATMKLARLRTLAQERSVAVLVDDDIKVCAAAEKAGYPVMRADWGLDAETQPTLFEAQETEGRT